VACRIGERPRRLVVLLVPDPANDITVRANVRPVGNVKNSDPTLLEPITLRPS